MPRPHDIDEIIEGSFTVVATREIHEKTRPRRRSPNQRRLTARILFWNASLLMIAVVLPAVL